MVVVSFAEATYVCLQMSVYGKRIGSAYGGNWPVPNEWAENSLVLEWWTPEHDDVLRRAIHDWHWTWTWKVTDKLVAVTPVEALQRWQGKDRLCRKYAWYNVLMYFAQARAQVLGYTRAIRRPERRNCPLCGEPFTEDSLPEPFVVRLGMANLDVCSVCMDAAILAPGRKYKTAEPVLAYIRKLADLAERVPPQGFGESIGDLVDVPRDMRLGIIQHLKTKPSRATIKTLFGSWFDALVAAEILDDGARRNSRGVQCRAKDGHMCHSLGEKTIDDTLFEMSIQHEREPPYPDSNYRADFKVGEHIIEYFGLIGNADYDAKTEAKLTLAKAHRLQLICIYPADLVSPRKLQRKLSRLLNEQH